MSVLTTRSAPIRLVARAGHDALHRDSQHRDPHVLYRLPSLAERLAAGRPVMTREQLVALSHRILRMSTFEHVSIDIYHTVNVITRLAHDHVLSSDDGDLLYISLGAFLTTPPVLQLQTNQLDDSTLLAAVQRMEAMARGLMHYRQEDVAKDERQPQDPIPSANLWHESTVQAMTTSRSTLVPAMIDAVKAAQLSAAGFIGLTARSSAYVSKKDGIIAFSEETDSEVTVTARTKDGTRTGWGGVTARDWSKLPTAVASAHAIRMATLCPGPPVAVEPGRRTAILAPSATVHLLRFLAWQFHAYHTDIGNTALSKSPRGNKLHQRIFDRRLSMSSDPADPEGGYCPYFYFGRPTPPMTWVQDGVLKNMAYDVSYAMQRGKAFAEVPYSFRLGAEAETPTKTVEEMIAGCKEGIFVNRFSNVDNVHLKSGMLTGTTRDGCFLIKDGKLSKAVKNFRIMDSPFFFLNKIEAIGTPHRAAFGWTKRGNWPQQPIIVPPLMVQDFNFSALADAT
jgi:predicted Zn-dependent protease